jgi:aminomethyltransferase
MSADKTPDLKRTPLFDLHVELGAKMVPFAGYEMPVQYPAGILSEHKHTRAAAGLFDVSHMGQARVVGRDPAAAMERLVPGDIIGLAAGQMRYSQFLNDRAGILDDLMISRIGAGELFIVVNAACKDADFALMRAGLADCQVEVLEDKALLALQGPAAASVMAGVAPRTSELVFMTGAVMPVAGIDCYVTRSGYTGEDGFEISVPANRASELARVLLDHDDVAPVGLGARDSLRLEAGLCLYGHDIDETTTPVEAALMWSVAKRRREDGGYPGAAVVRTQLQDGVTRKRVGIQPEGRAPAREGTEIVDVEGNVVGVVTSGGFGPTVGAPIAMGYVRSDLAKADTAVALRVRGKDLPARVAKTPFVPQRYFRG